MNDPHETADEAYDPDTDPDTDPLTEGMRSLDPDTILDSLVPQSIDWRAAVGRYPLGSVAAVGLVGYLVGRAKGATIMAGLSAGLSAALMRQLADIFEGDFFDF